MRGASQNPSLMQPIRAQRGFLLIAAVVLIVIAALILTVMVFLSATGNTSGAGNLQSGQALFGGESGLEYEQRRMALNYDWLRSLTDPSTPAGPQAFGTGTFATYSYLTGTEVSRYVSTSTTVICVFTVQRFPSSGYIQIGTDIISGEFVQYSGTTSSSAACNGLPAFIVAAGGLNATIGGVTGVLGQHYHGDNVYPVTTLIDPLSSTCVTPSTLRITDNSKFLDGGTICLDTGSQSEDISYVSSTRSGGVMTLIGLKRLGCAAWAAGSPVTPQLVNSSGGSPADYEAQAVATDTAGNAQRLVKRTIQR